VAVRGARGEQSSVDNPRAFRFRVALTLVAVSAAFALHARAASAAPSRGPLLSWEAPPECPSLGDLNAAIERNLGRPMREVAEPEFRARGRVSLDENFAWHVAIVLTSGGETRERHLSGSSCWEVTEATAVIVALVLDPTLGGRADEAATLKDEAPPTEEAPPPEAAPAASENPPPEPPALRLGARGPARPEEDTATPPPSEPGTAVIARPYVAWDGFALPASAFGIGGALGAAGSKWKLEASGAYFFEQRSEPSGNLAVDLSLLVAGPRGCYLPLSGSLELLLCGEAEIGVLQGKGVNAGNSRSGTLRWFALGAAALLQFELDEAVALVTGVDGLAPLLRDEFVVVGLGPVHELPLLTLRTTLGAEFRFR
jgi:hypothetical protein